MATFVGQVRNLSSALMKRVGFARQAGITFAGDRDLYAALGYKPTLSSEDLKARFLRSDIAGRLVEIYPKDTWRGGSEVIDSDDLDDRSPFMLAWDKLALRLQIWSLFERVDTLAGLGRYAVLVIGAPGNPDQPVGRVTAPEKIAYVTPFSEADAQIDEASIVTDEHDPRCGLPDFYLIKRLRGRKGFSRKYHHSRILHYADGLLDDPLYGQSRLERAWNRLDDLEKVVGAGSEAFWMRCHQGYVAEFDKDAEMTAEDVEDAREQAEEFAHQIRRTIGLQGGSFKALGSDVADFSNQVDSILTLIAGGAGVPKRMLIGSERGELASTQDRTMWEQRINDRRRELAEPLMVRPFVDRLIQWAALPTPKGGLYTVRWPGVDNLDDLGKSDVARRWALVNGSMKERVILPDEIRTRVLNLPPLKEVATKEQLDNNPFAVQVKADPNPNPDEHARKQKQDPNTDTVEPEMKQKGETVVQ